MKRVIVRSGALVEIGDKSFWEELDRLSMMGETMMDAWRRV